MKRSWRSFVALVLVTAWLHGATAAAAETTAPASQPTTAGGGAAKLILKKGDRLAIAGDSITEQKLYSRFMEDYLTVCTPQLDLWIIQLGWGGETAGGFVSRMNTDLLAFKPTVVTTCHGMNDGGYRKYDDSVGQTYEKAMRTLITKARDAGAVLVVGSPGAVDTTYFTRSVPAEVYNENLGQLGQIDRRLASEFGMVFADLHTPMVSVMAAAKASLGKDFSVGGRDGIHPDANGQLIMACAFLKAMGLNGDIGTITLDMDGGARASEGHKVLSAKDGTVEIESQRYPFCYPDKNAAFPRAILPFVQFNQDLNRLTLQVTGLKSDKAKVTWGKESRTFTRDQLAKGINLAEEFLDSPFLDAFMKVDALVAAKQAHETIMVKELNRSLRTIEGVLSDDAEAAGAVKTLRARLDAKYEARRAAVKAAFVPVKHTITVTPE